VTHRDIHVHLLLDRICGGNIGIPDTDIVSSQAILRSPFLLYASAISTMTHRLSLSWSPWRPVIAWRTGFPLSSPGVDSGGALRDWSYLLRDIKTTASIANTINKRQT
jgi:hypothetical protein